ncbi:MAG: PorV/PorQ family protein [Spirochaetes bacterium]|nr:PorV/PorQ family protein [Spirochaetota bacterium]
MKKIIRISMIIFITCLLPISFLHSAGTTSATFLKMGTTSRIIGMAEAFTAIADDASSIGVNPAGLGYVDNLEILFAHHEWVVDLDYEYLAVAKPAFKGIKGYQGVLGGSILYLHLPPFYQYDDWGESVGELSVNALAVTLGYGQKLGPFAFGNNLKLIREQVDDISEFAFGMDLGVIYKANLPPKRIGGFNLKGKSLLFGLSLLNVGLDRGIGGAPLPTTLKFGVGSQIFNGFLIDLDLEKPFDNRIRFNLGMEYTIKDLISIRGGYRFFGYDVDTFTLGMGIRYFFGDKLIKASTAYAPQGPLKNTANLTVHLKFPGKVGLENWRVANTLYYQGIYYYTRGELDKAIEIWEQVLKIYPNHEKARKKIKDALYLKDLKKIEKEKGKE